MQGANPHHVDSGHGRCRYRLWQLSDGLSHGAVLRGSRGRRHHMMAPNSSGVPPTISEPVVNRRSFTSGLSRTSAISLFRRLTIARGVPAGTNTPTMEAASYPGKPDAATVGKPGASAEGLMLVTASALSRPDLTCPVTAAAVLPCVLPCWFL